MNRHLVFIGPERPEDTQIGDHLNLFTFEGFTGEACHLDVAINHLEVLPNLWLYKGTTHHPNDKRDYLVDISLNLRNPAADTIILYTC